MIRIYFKLEKELKYFCESIYKKRHTIQVKWKRNWYWGNELTILTDHLDKDVLVACFRELFLHMRLDDMLQEVLENVYHYTDDAELEQISRMSKSMIGETNILELMNQLFRRYIWGSDVIQYDAMILFLKKSMSSALEEVAGRGIDELKLEEAHQQFILSTRIFLENRSYGSELVYIVQGKRFQFYKHDGTPFADLELHTVMMNVPLYIIGLDENEWNLAPVIALNPKRILIYGENASDAKTVSLMNIFEERVEMLPAEQFPFYKSK